MNTVDGILVREQLSEILRDRIGFEPGDLQECNETDLMSVAAACWNAGAEAALTRMEMEECDHYEGERLCARTKDAREHTIIKEI